MYIYMDGVVEEEKDHSHYFLLVILSFSEEFYEEDIYERFRLVNLLFYIFISLFLRFFCKDSGQIIQ